MTMHFFQLIQINLIDILDTIFYSQLWNEFDILESMNSVHYNS